MVSSRKLSHYVRTRLKENGITSRLDLSVIIQAGTGLSREALLAGEPVDESAVFAVKTLLQRRLEGEPLQYIAGSWPFLDNEFEVGRGVLIPRPETEKLALMASEFLERKRNTFYIDLCAGSGCVAISAAKSAAPKRAVAVELSDDAIVFCSRNANKLYSDLEVIKADIFGFERTLRNRSVNLITCNPPYVSESEYNDNLSELACEPKEAFVPAGNTTSYYEYIIENYKKKLKKGGAIMFECGSTMTSDVAAIFKSHGFGDIKEIEDDFSLPRFVTACVD